MYLIKRLPLREADESSNTTALLPSTILTDIISKNIDIILKNETNFESNGIKKVEEQIQQIITNINTINSTIDNCQKENEQIRQQLTANYFKWADLLIKNNEKYLPAIHKYITLILPFFIQKDYTELAVKIQQAINSIHDFLQDQVKKQWLINKDQVKIKDFIEQLDLADINNKFNLINKGDGDATKSRANITKEINDKLKDNSITELLNTYKRLSDNYSTFKTFLTTQEETLKKKEKTASKDLIEIINNFNTTNNWIDTKIGWSTIANQQKEIIEDLKKEPIQILDVAEHTKDNNSTIAKLDTSVINLVSQLRILFASTSKTEVDDEVKDIQESENWQKKFRVAANKAGNGGKNVVAIDKVWNEYLKTEWKGFNLKALLSISDAFIPELSAYGYTKGANPFIDFLKFKLADPTFEKIIIEHPENYTCLHNAVANRLVPLEDLRNGGFIGREVNIIFNNNLYNIDNVSTVLEYFEQNSAILKALEKNEYDNALLIQKYPKNDESSKKSFYENIFYEPGNPLDQKQIIITDHTKLWDLAHVDAYRKKCFINNKLYSEKAKEKAASKEFEITDENEIFDIFKEFEQENIGITKKEIQKIIDAFIITHKDLLGNIVVQKNQPTINYTPDAAKNILEQYFDTNYKFKSAILAEKFLNRLLNIKSGIKEQ